jgi:hypothetical protein
MDINHIWSGRICRTITFHSPLGTNGQPFGFNRFQPKPDFFANGPVKIGGVYNGFICFMNEHYEECWVPLNNIQSIEFDKNPIFDKPPEHKSAIDKRPRKFFISI